MNSLLDTHFLIWVALDSPRLSAYPWLERYAPWGVSPVSFLELQFLHEAGKVKVHINKFVAAVINDSRFVVDDVPLLTLIQRSLEKSWTRDPFDRLLAAHSAARRAPLCTVDGLILRNHEYLPTELNAR